MEQKKKLESKSIYDYTKILEEVSDYDDVRGIFILSNTGLGNSKRRGNQ